MSIPKLQTCGPCQEDSDSHQSFCVIYAIESCDGKKGPFLRKKSNLLHIKQKSYVEVTGSSAALLNLVFNYQMGD